ncbi:hypothetical protein MNBD_PLANCTO02-698, partial [hydrothermal vent metagenome]
MNIISRSLLIALIISLSTCYGASADEAFTSFQSDWKNQNDRVWIGPEYWANPMEDWQLKEGRLECTRLLPRRNVHLLTHRLGKEKGTFECSVILGVSNFNASQKGFAGFEIGIQSELKDYRSSLLRGKGIQIGINMQGEIVVPSARIIEQDNLGNTQAVQKALQGEGVKLSLFYLKTNEREESIKIVITDPSSGKLLHTMQMSGRFASKLIGNIALLSNPLPPHNSKQKKSTYWFKDWKVSGTKLVVNKEHTFGPILYSMYTLSRGVMKLNVQMPPMGEKDSQEVSLMYSNGKKSRAFITSQIDKHSRTALFTIKNWNDKKDISYRIVYNMKNRKGKITSYSFKGIIRKDPVDKETISVAGFTGNTDPAFPNNLLAENVKKQNPDLLLFTGDQIYEGVGGYGIIRSAKAGNKEKAILNYLRKIYLWGWAFRDVLRDRPSIVLPDDHDVYQGNIWGENGKLTPNGMKDH